MSMYNSRLIPIDGILGVRPRQLAAIKKHRDLETVLAHLDETIEIVDRIRDLFLNPAVPDVYDFKRTCSPTPLLHGHI